MNTTEMIEIGSFKEKLIFDYFLVCHKNMDLEQRGDVLKEQLGDNFLLLPRYSNTNADGIRFDTSLCLIYTPASEYDESKIWNKLKTINDERILIISYPVLNNGRAKLTERTPVRISEQGNYQYLTGYTFNKDKYKYYIAMGENWSKIAKELIPKVKNIILDKLFSGKNNDHRHVFEFNKFKVRDFKLQGSNLIVSNGANTLDQIADNETWSAFSQPIVLVNVLSDYAYPGESTSNIAGYYGMYDMKQLTIIPESLLIGLTPQGFSYKKQGKTTQSKQHMIPGSNDKALMAKIIRSYLSRGSLAATQIYFSDKMTLRDVISAFNAARFKSDNTRLKAEYDTVVKSILASNKDISTLTTDIEEIEIRSKNRLPIPKLVIDPSIIKSIEITKQSGNYGMQHSYCVYKGYSIPTKTLLRTEGNIPTVKINQEILEGGN